MSIKQAIEALEEADALLALGFNVENQIAEALTALRSMPVEPVAWYDVENGQIVSAPRWWWQHRGPALRHPIPSTAPKVASCNLPVVSKPLSDAEIYKVLEPWAFKNLNASPYCYEAARAIERAVRGEKP